MKYLVLLPIAMCLIAVVTAWSNDEPLAAALFALSGLAVVTPIVGRNLIRRHGDGDAL